MPNGTTSSSAGCPAAHRATARQRTLSARLSFEQAAWIHSHCHGATTVSLFLRQLVQQAMEHERSEVRRIQARLQASGHRSVANPSAELLAPEQLAATSEPERV